MTVNNNLSKIISLVTSKGFQIHPEALNLIEDFQEDFFKISYKKMPPLEIAKPYDTNSKIPKGVRKTINGLAKLALDRFTIELNINPVENAEKLPTTIPKIGINITKAILRLFKNMPISSILCI